MTTEPKNCVITRRGSDVGKNTDRRVYVTGPLFGIDVYSSTESLAEASRFTRREAERIIHKWTARDPEIEETTP